MWGLKNESPARLLSVQAVMASAVIHLPHGGMAEESQQIRTPLGGLSPGDNLGPTVWIGDGGILTVAPLLETSFWVHDSGST